MRSTAMSNSKYFIRGGGRWREIDLETGRVSGWAGTRFVFTKRGKLHIAGRRAVLAGLKNLSQNKPTTIHEGLQLPKIKIDHSKCLTISRSKDQKHCCACQHKSCNTDADFNNLLKPSTNSIAIQCNGELSLPNSLHKHSQDTSVRRTVTAVRKTIIEKDIQNVKHSSSYNDSDNFCKELEIDETDIEVLRKFIENDERNIFNVDLLLYDADDKYKQKIFYKINPIVKLVRYKKNKLRLNSEVKTKYVMRKGEDKIDSKNKLRLNSEVKTKYVMRKGEDKIDSKNKIGSDKVKTTDLDTEDSELRLGGQTAHSVSEPNIKIVEFIEDTDSDDNDLIDNMKEIHNSKQIREDKDGESRRNVINIEERHDRVKSSRNNKVIVNGYRGSGDSNQKSGTKDDRENTESNEGAVNKRNVEENSRNPRVMLKPMFVKEVNSQWTEKRDFSMLEDEAIVDWILKNDKGHCVKGNKLWKILAPIHTSITGQVRTWQSLRNRYLRYILPSLGSLSLSAVQATALRAAASAGELKTRQLRRRNSIFKTVRVRSAWNARPVRKPGARYSDDETSSPSRLLRSNTTIVSPSRHNLPTYSEITRRFAQKHRSTPNSDESEKRDRQTDKRDERANKISQTDNRQDVRLRRKDRVVNTDRTSRQLDRQNKSNVSDSKNNNVSDEKRHRPISRQGPNNVRIDTSSERSERPKKRPKIDKNNQNDHHSASKPNAEEKSNQKIIIKAQKYGKERNSNNEKSVNKAQLNTNDLQNNYNRPLTRHSLKNNRFDTDVESDFQSDSKNNRDNIRRRRKSNTDNKIGSENEKASENTRKSQIKTRHRRESETNAEYNKNSENRKEPLTNNRSQIEQRRRNTRSNKTDPENDTDIESETESRIKTRQREKSAVENIKNNKYSDKNIEKVKSNRSKREKGRQYETDTEHNSSRDTDIEDTATDRRLRRNNLMTDQITDNVKNSRNKSEYNSKSNRNGKTDREYDNNFDTDDENSSPSLVKTRNTRRSTNSVGIARTNNDNLEHSKAKNGQIHTRKINDTDDDSNVETDGDSVKNQSNTRKLRMDVRRTAENQRKSNKPNEVNKDSRSKRSPKRNTERTDAKIVNKQTSERRRSKINQINTESDSDDEIQNKRKRTRNMTDTESGTDSEREKLKIHTRKNSKNETDDSEFDINNDTESSGRQTESDLTDSSLVNTRPTTRLSIRSDKPVETTHKPRNIRLHNKDGLKPETDRISSRINIVFESNSDEASNSDTEGDSDRRERRKNSRNDKEINKTDVSKDQDRKITRNLRRLFNPKAAV